MLCFWFRSSPNQTWLATRALKNGRLFAFLCDLRVQMAWGWVQTCTPGMHHVQIQQCGFTWMEAEMEKPAEGEHEVRQGARRSVRFAGSGFFRLNPRSRGTWTKPFGAGRPESLRVPLRSSCSNSNGPGPENNPRIHADTNCAPSGGGSIRAGCLGGTQFAVTKKRRPR